MNRNGLKIVAVVVIGFGFAWLASSVQLGRVREYPLIAATIAGGAGLFVLARMLQFFDAGRAD